MMNPTRLTQLALLALALLGFKSLMLFSMQNGLVNFFEQVQETSMFPPAAAAAAAASGEEKNHGEPLSPLLPGWHPTMDWQLKAHVVFLWSFVDGHRPDLALVLLEFVGAFGAAWMLIVMDSLRKGNKGAGVSYILIPGILIFNHSHAIMTPLYLTWNLLLSPLVKNSGAAAFAVDAADTTALLVSFVLAYIAPLVVIGLPMPALISPVIKQTVIAWYQQWNVYIALVHFVVCAVIRRMKKSSSSSSSARRSRHRLIYAFAFSLAFIPHFVTVTLACTAASFPGLFAGNVGAMLVPRSVFIPPSPWSDLQAPSLAEGCKWLLQWDFILGSMAMLCWAGCQYLNVCARVRNFHGVQDNGFFWTSLVPKVVFFALLAGPVGAAVELMWERDELLFDSADIDIGTASDKEGK